MSTLASSSSGPFHDSPTLPGAYEVTGHCRTGSEIYGVLQGEPSFLTKIPLPRDAPSIECDSKDMKYDSPRYVHPSTAYMIFIPLHNPWHGPLLDILDWKHENLPIIEAFGQWILRPDVADKWLHFETCIRKVSLVLMSLHPNHTLPKQLRPWATPYRYGYMNSYKSERVARAAVWHARRSFLPLLGFLSMGLWYARFYPGDKSWRDELVSKAGVHRAWLALLESSSAGDWTIPRVGGLFDFSGEHSAHDYSSMNWLLDTLFKLLPPVPLYFYWGKQAPYHRILPCLEECSFFPNGREITYLEELPGKVAFSGWTVSETEKKVVYKTCRESKPYVPPATSRFPPVERHSGQREGETMAAFFKRRQEENQRSEATETPQAAASRRQREEHARRGQCPGRGGARVYVWEDETGEYIRRAAGRKNYSSYWEDYGPQQRRYNSFRDEWDLCDAFGPDAEDSDGDLDYDPPQDQGMSGNDQYDDGLDLPQDLLPESTVPVISGDVASAGDLSRIFQLNAPTAPDPVHAAAGSVSTLQDLDPDYNYGQVAATFADALYLRFGFTTANDAIQVSADLKKVDIRTIRKLVGLSVDSETHVDNACIFFTQCQRGKPEVVSPELFDYHQVDQCVLYESWPFKIRREYLHNSMAHSTNVHYILDNGSNIVLLLESATTTLEILRQGWGPTIREVVTRLLGRGMPFRFCLRSSKIKRPSEMGRRRRRIDVSSGLGYRPLNYKPTMYDYKAYVTLRALFLESPRGRAALQCGGIVGRLARSAVSDLDVLMGPSEDVFTEGGCLWDGTAQQAYWDDCLTDDELDLICGVYHVGTGQVDHGSSNINEQTTQVSWWPKPNSFNGSGLDVGWWSPDCEAWFQKRRTQILEEKAFLCTNAKWKHSLKFDKFVNTLMVAHEKVSAAVLDTLCATHS